MGVQGKEKKAVKRGGYHQGQLVIRSKEIRKLKSQRQAGSAPSFKICEPAEGRRGQNAAWRKKRLKTHGPKKRLDVRAQGN